MYFQFSRRNGFIKKRGIIIAMKNLNKKTKTKPHLFLAGGLLLSAALLSIALCGCGQNQSSGEENENYRVAPMLQTDLPVVFGIGDFIEDTVCVQDGRPRYDLMFEGNIVIGDSVSEGLSAYKFLREDQVVSKIGASVMRGEEAVEAAAKAKPKNVFFSYGSNDMGMYSGNAELFAEQYKAIIEEFCKQSPDTRVFVNSIPKPSDEKIASGGQFHKWEEFNAEIKSMCKELDIEYLDNTDILKEHPELYAGDGIHVGPGYYTYWLGNMLCATFKTA